MFKNSSGTISIAPFVHLLRSNIRSPTIGGIKLYPSLWNTKLSTALWRAFGLDVKELFIAPYKARSLKEFWGKRWNMAFSEMTASIVYKPLLPDLGKQKAVAASFLFSGILHEIAISFPVQSGYGLPLSYFTLHALLMFMESKIIALEKITTHAIWGHVWVMTWLIVPLPLLFHRNFIDEVAKPLAYSILELLP